MHEVLDLNKDKKVTVADFENLAIKYLCGQGLSSSNFQKFTESKTTITSTTTKTTRTTAQM